MQSGSARWMLTAGHCSESTTTTQWFSGTSFVGDLLEHWNYDQGDDVGWLWNSTYAGRMYSGLGTDFGGSSTWVPVKGYSSPTVGTPLNASGQRYGDQGTGTVAQQSHFNLCVGTDRGYTICHLHRITSSTVLWNTGDSGGPVYIEYGGRYAAGMIESRNVANSAYYFVPLSRIIAVDSVAMSTY